MKFFLLLFVSFLHWQTHLNNEIALKIQEPFGKRLIIKMPLRDAKRLEWLFLNLMVQETWAYTLGGSKPVSFCFGELPFPSLPSLFPMTIRFALGWKTWEKYHHLLENSRFEMWREIDPQSKRIQGLIVDKFRFADAIEENREDFCKVLQKDPIQIDDLLVRPVMRQPFVHHNALLGILLGFGRGNAWWFFHRERWEKNPSVWEAEIHDPILRRFVQKFWSLNKFEITDMLLPAFAGDGHSEESIALKKRYLSIREELFQYYQGKNFLEATLSLYKSGPDILKSPVQ